MSCLGAFRRTLVAVSAVLLLAGCSAQSVSQLQTNYQALLQQQRALDQQTGAYTQLRDIDIRDWNSREAWEERDTLASNFHTLAIEAEKLATDTSNDLRATTRASALRLAGVAAWQAGERGKDTVVAVRDRGLRLCAQLPRENFGVPRDCAILAQLDALQLFEAINIELARLYPELGGNADRTPASFKPTPEAWLADMAKLVNAYTSLERLFRRDIPDIRNRDREKGYAGVDETTIGYFESTVWKAWCRADAASTWLRDLRRLVPAQATAVAGLLQTADATKTSLPAIVEKTRDTMPTCPVGSKVLSGVTPSAR